jgi:hypothetical protein
MAKARKKTKRVVDDADDDDLEIEPSERDFVMARLAAGRAAAQSAITAIDDVLNLFVNPHQDKRGKEREDGIGEALEALGCATRAVETAESTFDQVDLTECEPWDDEADEEDEDEDEEDESEEDED